MSRLIRLVPDGAVSPVPTLPHWQEFGLSQQPGDAVCSAGEPAPDCRRQLQEAEARGYERGRQDGFAAGAAAGREQAANELLTEWSGQIEAVFGELRAFIAEHRDYRVQLERSLVELVMAVAAKLAGQLRIQDPSAVLALIRQTANETGELGHAFTVRVHPQSLPALEAAAKDDGPAGVRFIADQSLNLGDALVETSHGSYDLRIATLLERVRQRLHEELGLP